MLKPIRKVYDWASLKATSPHAPVWLGVVFLLEVILFLPLDGLLMLFCMQNRKRRFLYAAVATCASTLIALVGYAVGYLLWDSIGPYVIGNLVSDEFFNRLVGHYQQHANLAVFIGSLLPIPFKAITLSAGFCQLPLTAFIFSVLAARAVRFFLIAQSMHLWGDKIKAFIDRHFNRLVMAVGAKIALTVGFFLALGS